MDADEPSAAEPQPQRYGVRGLVRAFGRRVVAVECGTVSKSPGPLDAALLWRQVAKAAKAVTSHRTPNSCRLCAEFHQCSTDSSRFTIVTRAEKGSNSSHPCSSVSIRG